MCGGKIKIDFLRAKSGEVRLARYARRTYLAHITPDRFASPGPMLLVWIMRPEANVQGEVDEHNNLHQHKMKHRNIP